MSKRPKTKQIITLSEIADSIKTLGLSQSRTALSSKLGSRLEIAGTVIKVVKRDEKIKLFIQTDLMKIFADFGSKADFLLHVKKNQSVTVTGLLVSFGYDAVCLNKCSILKA